MSDAANPFHSAGDDAGTTDDGPVQPTDESQADESQADELAVLDELEADLAAVDTAIATIDRIGADGIGGEQAATEIRAAVSVTGSQPPSVRPMTTER